MAIAYFDCYSGVAGDMILGALIDVGLPIGHLRRQLALVRIGSFEIVKDRSKKSIAGTNIHVRVKRQHGERHYPEIDRMIAGSRLPRGVKELARTVFERLGRAEARVHGIALSRVHFHEVGAVDSVVDIVGAAIGLDYFGFESIHSSPLPITRGRVKTAHGWLPIPAPATMELLKGIPVERGPVRDELVTPTGAAILTSVCESFGENPLHRIDKVGYGFGDKVFPDIPNALRLMVGEGYRVVVIQADIDDMNPQVYDHVIDCLFDCGAADVELAPVQMKKNRPAVRLSVLCPWERKDDVMDLILRETTTFGVRYFPVERKILERKLVIRNTRFGNISFKIGLDDRGRAIKAVPEYDDVKKLAKKLRRPLLDIYADAAVAARKIVKES